MRIACVLRSGGIYTPEWVAALVAGIREHSPALAKAVVCLTDMDVDVPGVKVVPLAHDWPGWWAKLELFRRFVVTTDEQLVLYLDLDTVVMGALEPFASYQGGFAMLSDFYQPEIPASGVLLFRAGHLAERLYRIVSEDPAKAITSGRRSDYWYARHILPDRLQELYPGKIVSLKVHCRSGQRPAPDGAALVCGHGKPHLDKPTAGWAHQVWRERVA